MHSTNVLGTVLVVEDTVVSKMGSCLTAGYFHQGIIQCTRRKYLQRVSYSDLREWKCRLLRLSGQGRPFWAEGIWDEKVPAIGRQSLPWREGQQVQRPWGFVILRNIRDELEVGRGLSLARSSKSAFRVWVLFWAPWGTFKVAFLSPQLPPLSEDTITFCLQPVSLLVVSLLCPISSWNDLKNKSTNWILSA